MTKLALIQNTVLLNKEHNILQAQSHILKAAKKGANIIVLPELFQTPYLSELFHQYAEEPGGMTERMLCRVAKETKCLIVGGSIIQKIDNKFYNSTIVVGTDGEVIAVHQKLHLFEISQADSITFKEADYLEAGHNITVVATEYGRIGIAICYDIRFPQLFDKMEALGAQLIIVPAAFNTITGPLHWHLLARARAMDTQTYVALCSPANTPHSPFKAYGHSLVVDPYGTIVAEADQEETLLFADCDFSINEGLKISQPYRRLKRPELYV